MLTQLPPKRRQIIRLLLKRSDIISAKAAIRAVNGDASEKGVADDMNSQNLDEYKGNLYIGFNFQIYCVQIHMFCS